MRQIACDCIVIKNGRILLIKRKGRTYNGYWALPGGRLEDGERCEECAERELYEETGIKAKAKKLYAVLSDPKRDPRGMVSVVFLCEPEEDGEPKAGDDAEEVRWFSLEETKHIRIAFDHREVIEKALSQTM